jgi:DNA invertase Pin-like site-specific DNA recombinase
VIAEFADEGISGAKGRAKRPGLDKLLRAVSRREVDIVAAWSVDRLGRSLWDLLETLGEIHAKHVDLYPHQQGLDTGTPAGRALFQMLGVFAEFEREIIKERVNAGIARARKLGTTSGRAIGRPRSDKGPRAMLAAGTGIRKTSRDLGVGVSVEQRTARESAAA